MVNQSSISFVLSISSRIRKTLFSLMIMIRRQGNTSCLSLGFLNLRALYLQANCINGDHLSSCMSLKNMQGMRVISIYAGAEIFRWNFKKQTNNIEMQKAPICGRSLLYTHRCMMKECTSIIASCAIYCNTLMGCYV